MVKDAMPVGTKLVIQTFKSPKGKYGRWLAYVVEPIDIAAHLVAAEGDLGEWRD